MTEDNYNVYDGGIIKKHQTMTDKIISISQAKTARDFGGVENMGKVYYPKNWLEGISSFVAYAASVMKAETHQLKGE